MTEGREVEKQRTTMKRILLIINTIMLGIGASGSPLLMRLYFIHGGQRVWLSSCLVTIGFPIILLPLTISYILSSRSSLTIADTKKPKMFSMTPLLFFGFSVIGVLTGLGNYLYAFGSARLPVSTSTLIMASSLAFTAFFAFFLVRQKFTSYSVNAVVLLIVGAGMLAERGGSDRPVGESTKQYVLGFVMILVSAAMSGLTLPIVELMYKKTSEITYTLVMELQMVMGLSGTLFNLVGMIIDGDFKVIPREARNFGLGETKYYIVLVGSAILWQLYMLGAIGVVFCSSSLFTGIVNSMLLPVTEVLAVIFYKEKFQAEKGISLVLSLWGFVSYFYGEFIEARKIKRRCVLETELSVNNSIHTP